MATVLSSTPGTPQKEIITLILLVDTDNTVVPFFFFPTFSLFRFFFYFSSSLHTPITEIFIFFFPSVSAGTPTLMIEGRAD